MADTTSEQQPQPGVAPEPEGAENERSDGGLEPRESTENGNKFQQAVAAWRALDLSKLVSNLDTAASDMVDQQKDSLVQRKELAQKTKEFRKLEDAAKLVAVKDLLKAYQGYIDVVTNHNKAVSSAFMQAYSPLSEAPDPYPLLEASIDALLTADELVPKLESENEGLHKQVATLNDQLEETEKQMEDERTKRQSFEGAQDSRVHEVEDSWKAVLKEKEDNWLSKERSLEEKVENQERLLKELKATYEVSQRLEKSDDDEHGRLRNTAIAAELEIVNSELEKANTRIAEVEARNELLRVESAQLASHSHSKATAVEEDPSFLRLRSENTSLLRRLDNARYSKDADRKNLENKVRLMERDVGTLKADRDALQKKISNWSDYEEVKRELEMLRAIEFAGLDGSVGDHADLNSSADGIDPESSPGESLEQLLVSRNKKLGNELIELRVSHTELQQTVDKLREEHTDITSELDKARSLNATLENDLQKTQQEAANAFETMSVAGTHYSRYTKSVYGGGRKGGSTSPTSSIIGGFDSGGSMRSNLDALRAGEPVGGGSGILPMVTAQRDRFKKKMSELEQELQKQYQSVSSLRNEVASLQKDNLNLYEKSRYVSLYNRSGGQPSIASGATYAPNLHNSSPVAIQVGSADTPSGLSLDRYRSKYEQNISPFAAFRGRESARALRRMSLPERAVFQITRLVLATRTSRNLFAAYCLALHVLVMSILYWMSTVDIEQHASSLSSAQLASSVVAAAGGAAGVAAADDWQQEGFQAGA